jgi:hypothetical protein
MSRRVDSMAEIRKRNSESLPKQMTNVEEHFALENMNYDYDDEEEWFLPFTDFYEDE